MDDPKVVESSTSSSASPTPSPAAAPPALLPVVSDQATTTRRTSPAPTQSKSSAALLHHLHTHPASHHITLSSGNANARHASAPPMAKGSRSSAGPIRPPLSSGDTDRKQSDGSLRPPEPLSRRTSSKRGRPSTAPSRPGASPTGDGQESPGLADASPQPSVKQLQSEASDDESCLATFARGEDVQHAAEAMSMLSVSGDPEAPAGKTHLVGRAGSMAPSSSPTAKKADSSASHATDSDDVGWDDFAKEYAAGNFDPRRIPHPPTQSIPPRSVASARSSPGTRYPSLDQNRGDQKQQQQQPSSSDTNSSGESAATSASVLSADTNPSSAPSISTSRSISATSTTKGIAIKAKSLEAENLLNRSQQPKPDKLMLPSYNLAAATVRMASVSSGFGPGSLAPLGVPSPDKELTDPMAHFVSSASKNPKEDSNSDPSHGTRFPLSRSMSSAIDPDRGHSLQLPTIQGSPVSSPFEHPRHLRSRQEPHLSKNASSSWSRGGMLQSHLPPATAPVEKTVEAETQEDYFGKTLSPTPPGNISRQDSYNSSGSSSQQTVTGPLTGPATLDSHPHPDGRDETSPTTSPKLDSPPRTVHHSQMGELYGTYGWLPAPLPPDEVARRRALYRFNILHTAADLNFDRIAHMAKLVFASKIVLIALIDGDTQWHKTQAGPAIASEVPRAGGFCAHTILSKNDEPLIVLDTKNDWRFAENDYVTGAPFIRFYAGAPLRTSDGYNLGTLCLLDDKPRAEFAPRQRLILKEFAAIAMREMELWRDKLQLRVRDRIQTAMEKFTRECLEMDAKSADDPGKGATKMDKVYTRAAQLVCSTLDMEECHVLDLSSFELMTVETSRGPQSVFRADPYRNDEEMLERSDNFGPVNALPILATTNASRKTEVLSSTEHEKLSSFLRDARDGKIYEHKPPSWIRSLFPEELRYAMVVPVFGINQQPFALIVAHTSKASKQYLEGYELQFLRAIGVILLSAVLRRRMVLADKAKSILISSVSHELRTPLHGILAAAELLADSDLDQNQLSFLRTVQSCGNSLIETVNHVLDFTKLSGAASNPSGRSIKLSKVNLSTLIEQTVEGCWVGQRARTFLGDNDVGSYYAPDAQPKTQRSSSGIASAMPIEIVIDIAHREKGWNVRCEKSGLRRVLMNLIGNSLKFTKEGYIQVTLRELPHEPGSRTVPLEMAVIDTGKGIGKEFLKEQLFHPFSQENPLQTGTGLGLAIVNSIVRSENVNGKVDVWSSEGMGTEIRISLDVDVIDEEDDTSSNVSTVSAASSFGQNVSVSLIGFEPTHRGHMLSLDVLSSYACSWHFDVKETGDIIIVHEDESLVQSHRGDGKPIIFLTGTRRGEITSIANKISQGGGFFHIVYKPIGPSGLRHALQAAVDYIESPPDPAARPSISRGSSGASQESASTVSELSSQKFKSAHHDRMPLQRRRSEETEHAQPTRPAMAPRGLTYHHGPSAGPPRRTSSADEEGGSPSLSSPSSSLSTISLADGGALLKAAALPAAVSRRGGVPRVLVVEDNVINRRVLGAFLKKRGCEWAEAFHGQEGVEVFQSTPPNHWDVILMDISMPIMDGHAATRAIRKIEAERRSAVPPIIPPLSSNAIPSMTSTIPVQLPNQSRAKIFALTGLATPDDKREAFASGVDGYLVKPVSLASLDQIFKRVGFA